jgi:hypothetical protein
VLTSDDVMVLQLGNGTGRWLSVRRESGFTDVATRIREYVEISRNTKYEISLTHIEVTDDSIYIPSNPMYTSARNIIQNLVNGWKKDNAVITFKLDGKPFKFGSIRRDSGEYKVLTYIPDMNTIQIQNMSVSDKVIGTTSFFCLNHVLL